MRTPAPALQAGGHRFDPGTLHGSTKRFAARRCQTATPPVSEPRNGTRSATFRPSGQFALFALALHDVQPGLLDELVVAATSKEFVHSGGATCPTVVVVDHEATAGHHVRIDLTKADHH